MILKLPLYVVLPRKKGDRKWILNQNNYRNTHYLVLNNVKKIFAEKVKQAWHEEIYTECLLPLPQVNIKPPFIFVYTLYPDSNRRMDVSNVCSVVDKFTCDALVELGIISDDNHKVISAINYRFGKVDKENPRVELEISEYR